jgi:EAL domain-containing protein (putative c-di-GMP-specific phosphodiesterase class I)
MLQAAGSTELNLIDRILAPGGLTVMLQPIINAEGPAPVVHSYECLSRGPAGTNMESAEILFEYIRRKKVEKPLDRACIEAGLEAGSRLAGLPHLALNVHSITIATDREFPEFLKKAASARGISTTRLTVEIVEHAPTWHEDSFLDTLIRLRQLGIQIALDDVGLGHSNYKMILEADPDYLKIDRFFVTNCQNDRKRRAVIQSIVELAHQFESSVIAEGVETEEEFDWLLAHGVHLFQGYYFSPPLPIEVLMKSDWQTQSKSGGLRCEADA